MDSSHSFNTKRTLNCLAELTLTRHRSSTGPGGTHCSDTIMGAMASQITSLNIVYSTVYWGADQRKHQSSASVAFVRPVTRKMFPFDDVIMPQTVKLCMMMSWNGNIFRVIGPLCGGFAAQKPVTPIFDVFFDLRLNKPLNKQSKRRWFETP